MDLYGKALAPRELRRRVGRLGQVAGIEPFIFEEGPARGVRALRFRTGGGLSFDVLCDRGMDLGAAEYRGAPLAWLSRTSARASRRQPSPSHRASCERRVAGVLEILPCNPSSSPSLSEGSPTFWSPQVTSSPPPNDRSQPFPQSSRK